jgi:hypothetical protein
MPTHRRHHAQHLAHFDGVGVVQLVPADDVAPGWPTSVAIFMMVSPARTV